MRIYRSKKSKVIVLSLLAVLVTAFSIGFATMTQSFSFSTKFNVNPIVDNTDNFKVVFSSNSSSLQTNSIVATKSSDDLIASDAIIDNTSNSFPTISNFNVTLYEPGDKVEYVFYARNDGAIDAYLKSITFNNVSGGSSPIKCTTIDGTNETEMASVCEDMVTVTVTVGGESATDTKSITNHLLTTGSSEQVTISIEFNSDAAYSDTLGDFKIKFGDISLFYSEVDGDSTEGEITLEFSPSAIDFDMQYVATGSNDYTNSNYPPNSYLYFSNVDVDDIEIDGSRCEYYGLWVHQEEFPNDGYINIWLTATWEDINNYGTTSGTYLCAITASAGDASAILEVGLTVP